MARVLVVDDDPDVLEACRLFLEKAGHTVSCAGNRQQGMDAIRSQKPDLLLLDIMMEQPDDGLAMAQELRRGGFRSPIVMLTSISRVTGMKYAADEEMAPVEAFLEKPVAPATLLNKVTELLAQKAGEAGPKGGRDARK
jgi:DNA-binding response OmpR family regulator